MELSKNKDVFSKSLTKKSEQIKTGIVTRPHGIKGEIFVKSLNESPEWPAIQEIFIEKVNYSVESYRPHKGGWIFKLKGVESRNESEALKGKEVFLSKELLISSPGENIYLSEILDFSVECEKKSLGFVRKFSSSLGQDYIHVFKDEKDLPIPFVSAYVEEVDFVNKTLKLQLPPHFPGLEK